MKQHNANGMLCSKISFKNMGAQLFQNAYILNHSNNGTLTLDRLPCMYPLNSYLVRTFYGHLNVYFHLLRK